jgi:hypothetical protein
MADYGSTFAELGDLFGRINRTGLFRPKSDPAIEAARMRFRQKRARQRRREATAPYLREPWSAWSGTDDAAAIARRFFRRFPERDRPDPADDILTDRQAAALYHLEEAEDEERRGREFEW